MGLSSFNRMRRSRAEQAKQVQETPTNRALESYTAQEIIDMNAKEQKAFIEQHELAIDGYKSMKAPELEQALLTYLGHTEKEDSEATKNEAVEDAVVNTAEVSSETSDAQ